MIGAPVVSQVLLWITALSGVANLCGILFFAFKSVNRVEAHLDDRDRRLTELETVSQRMQTELKILVGVSAKLEDLGREIERMRNRLDRFLDGVKAQA